MNRVITLLAAAILAGSVPGCSHLPTDPNENGWRLLQGHVERLAIPAFRNGRECWVYLPPGYTHSTRRYPVLYLNDGLAVLTGGVQANRICEDLIRSGEIDPLILVAISVPDSERFWDYAPWPAFYLDQEEGGGGFHYVRAIRDTLKPEIDRRFRTLPDRAHTGIAGYSLGGLISAFAGFECDDTFGLVGACSPSYWWAGGPIYDYPVSRSRQRLPLRYYQDSGHPYDNDIRRMEELLLMRGFFNGIDLKSITVAGAEHSNPAWEHRFPDMLRFLFGRGPAPAP